MPGALASPPEQGQLVSVRSRNWIVNEVAPSTLPTDGLYGLGNGQTLLTLSSIEDDGLGEELPVVWELEPGCRIIEKVALPEPTGFDPPKQLNAFLFALGPPPQPTFAISSLLCVPGSIIEDDQLDPVVRAIQMPRVNLLIADDVGLGKTIEAGMVALELIIRHRTRKILAVCPSSLQVQWHQVRPGLSHREQPTHERLAAAAWYPRQPMEPLFLSGHKFQNITLNECPENYWLGG